MNAAYEGIICRGGFGKLILHRMVCSFNTIEETILPRHIGCME